ncbi:hypothetical protein BLOT_009517 [Blomia tropicalis]|nr:hypothetical protein BLOT_009517 [Blomia tropicalis]
MPPTRNNKKKKKKILLHELILVASRPVLPPMLTSNESVVSTPSVRPVDDVDVVADVLRVCKWWPSNCIATFQTSFLLYGLAVHPFIRMGPIKLNCCNNV